MKIKHKEQILKAAREKQQITHKGIPIRITADLSIETLQERREWQDILKVMKENNLQPRLLLEKEMATHSSALAWRIQWREEPGRLQSMGSQRVRHDLARCTTTTFQTSKS